MKWWYIVVAGTLLVPAATRAQIGREGVETVDPICSWSFDDIEGKLVPDASGHGVTGRIRGTVEHVPGLDGAAIRLNGQGWVASQRPITARDGLTVEAWVRPELFRSGEYYTLVAQVSGKDQPDWVAYHTGWNDLFGFYVVGESGRSRVDLIPGFLMDGWRHYVATYDAASQQVAVYVDGVRIRAGHTNGRLVSAQGILVLGSYKADSASMGFVGDVDELRVYDVALTDQQIIAAFMERKPMPAVDHVVIRDFPATMRAAVTSGVGSEGRSWVRESRVVSHRFSRDVTPAEADAVVRAMREQGATCLIPEGFRYLLGRKGDPNDWWKSMPEADYLRAMKVIREACDRYGIKLLGRITANVGLPGYVREHPEFAALDFKTGEPAGDRGYHIRMDMNNPGYVEDFLATLDLHMQAVRYEGLHVDETTFRSLSMPDSTYNRQLLFRDYNVRMDRLAEKGVYDSISHPDWRRWIQFRIDTEDRFRQRIMAVARSNIQGEPLLSGTNNDIRPASPRLAGADLERQSSHQTLNFYECEPLGLHSWRNAFSESKVYNSLNPAAFLSYSTTTSQQYFVWALAKTCGMTTNLWPEFNAGPDMPLNWEATWSPVLAYQRTWSDVAVMYSMPTVAMSRRYDRFYDSFLGWVQALTDAHIPVAAVSARGVTLEDLKQYQVVILPDVSCISDASADVLRQYVAAGGHIVATGETGAYDELGDRREINALQDVLGVRIAEQDQPGGVLRFSGSSRAPAHREIRYPDGMQRIDEVVGRASRVVAWVNRDTPAIVVSRYHAGRVCYMALRPGTRYFMPKVGHGWYGHGGYWYDDRDRGCRDMMRYWVAAFSGDHFVETQNLPEEVLLNPFRHELGAYRGVAVQMLNLLSTRFDKHAIGPRFANYELLDYPSPNQYIPESERMTLSIASEHARSAYFVSPDYESVVRLPLRDAGPGRVAITLEDFPRYGFVYIVESESDIIADVATQIVDEWPSIEPFVVEQVAFYEDFEAFSELAVRIPFPNWIGSGNADMLVRSDLDHNRKGVRVQEISSPQDTDRERYGRLTTARPFTRDDAPAVYDASLWVYCHNRIPGTQDPEAGSLITVRFLNENGRTVGSARLRHHSQPNSASESGSEVPVIPGDRWVNIRVRIDEAQASVQTVVEDDQGHSIAEWVEAAAPGVEHRVVRLSLQCEALESGAAFQNQFDEITVRQVDPVAD